jgi:hypothetical protein
MAQDCIMRRSTLFAALLPLVGGCSSTPVEPEPEPSGFPVTIPSGAEYWVGNFADFADDSLLHAFAGTQTPLNVHAEPGVGMRYDFIPRPNRCGDQALVSQVRLPEGTQQVWMRFRMRFSANWTNENPNCPSPNPDYKAVLVWLKDTDPGRFDFKIGTSNRHWDIRVPAWSKALSPVTVQQPGRQGSNPMSMSRIWDGQWHLVDIHFGIQGEPERAVSQVRVDGINIGSFETGFAAEVGLAGNSLASFYIGANRNLGNPDDQLMQVWWDEFRVWVDEDPGFRFQHPTPYY